jgi:iron complex outermembrane receptor protein
VQGIPDGSRDSLSRKFTYQQFEGMEDDIKSRPLVSDEKLNSYAPADLHQQIKHYRIYAKQNIEINKGNLNYTLAWQHNVRKEITHPTDLNQAGLFVKLNTINYSILYQLPETKNSATAIGVNGMWQYNKNDKATDFPIPNYQLFDAGCFIHQTHRMSRYTLSGGIRYDIRQVNVYDLFTLLNTETGFTEQSNQEYNPENYHQYQAFEKSFHGLSGSVGISYQVDDHFYLKANFSRGYRAPSITEIASNGLDPGARIVYLGNKNFKAEFSNQQDLGAFWENKNFDASMSIFNNYIENYIYLAQLADNNNIAITDAQGNRTFQYQQAKAQLYGFESSFNIHPINWKGFSIHQSFQMVRGLNRSNQYKNSGINGEFLPFIPPAQWACELAQKLPLPNTKIKNLIPKVAFEYFADQARYMALYGTETYTPAYFLISASLHLELYEKGNKQLNFFVFANNIADVVYQSNMSRLKYFEYFNDTRPNSSGIYNMGRNIGAKLVYNF